MSEHELERDPRAEVALIGTQLREQGDSGSYTWSMQRLRIMKEPERLRLRQLVGTMAAARPDLSWAGTYDALADTYTLEWYSRGLPQVETKGDLP